MTQGTQEHFPLLPETSSLVSMAVRLEELPAEVLPPHDAVLDEVQGGSRVQGLLTSPFPVRTKSGVLDGGRSRSVRASGRRRNGEALSDCSLSHRCFSASTLYRA